MMKTLPFKTTILSALLGLSCLASAKSPYANKYVDAKNKIANAKSQYGTVGGGGGDMCEDRIKVVRDDLRSWIEKGGPSDPEFHLPAPWTPRKYSQEMLTQIARAKIRCVGPNDKGFPVLVNGTPKVCRFDRHEDSSQITCDIWKMHTLYNDQVYSLVHHEFAGLAKLEVPNREDSDYTVSNQISDYLEEQVVQRMALKKSPRKQATDNYLDDVAKSLFTMDDGVEELRGVTFKFKDTVELIRGISPLRNDCQFMTWKPHSDNKLGPTITFRNDWHDWILRIDEFHYVPGQTLIQEIVTTPSYVSEGKTQLMDNDDPALKLAILLYGSGSIFVGHDEGGLYTVNDFYRACGRYLETLKPAPRK